MATISIRDLHLNTGRWVRKAGENSPIVITDRGRPVASLTAFDPADTGKALPDRERTIRRRTRISVDSSVYVSEMRNKE